MALRSPSTRWYSPWIIPAWHAPAVEPESLPDPILVVHAAADRLEPVEHTRHFVARLGSRCRYVELSGCSHQGTMEAEGLRVVGEFIAAVEARRRQ